MANASKLKGPLSLREYLDETGILQRDFADLIGKSGPTVSRLVKGTANPDLATLEVIERVTKGIVPRTMFTTSVVN